MALVFGINAAAHDSRHAPVQGSLKASLQGDRVVAPILSNDLHGRHLFLRTLPGQRRRPNASEWTSGLVVPANGVGSSDALRNRAPTLASPSPGLTDGPHINTPTLPATPTGSSQLTTRLLVIGTALVGSSTTVRLNKPLVTPTLTEVTSQLPIRVPLRVSPLHVEYDRGLVCRPQ